MKRTIIKIDHEKCDGCGLCVNACHEGAIALRNGKAYLVREDYCDGLGSCIGTCPQGAISFLDIETDERVDAGKTAGPAPHAPGAAGVACDCTDDEPATGGCPGARMRQLTPNSQAAAPSLGDGLPPKVIPSDLAQWPVQLHLVPIRGPFYQERELVVLSTCAPVASADVHWRFLRGRAVVVACPKLDVTDPYVQKMAAIFRENRITRVCVVRMSVPCCGGLTRMVQAAAALSGRTDLPLEEITVELDGAVTGRRAVLPV